MERFFPMILIARIGVKEDQVAICHYHPVGHWDVVRILSVALALIGVVASFTMD